MTIVLCMFVVFFEEEVNCVDFRYSCKCVWSSLNFFSWNKEITSALQTRSFAWFLPVVSTMSCYRFFTSSTLRLVWMRTHWSRCSWRVMSMSPRVSSCSHPRVSHLANTSCMFPYCQTVMVPFISALLLSVPLTNMYSNRKEGIVIF